MPGWRIQRFEVVPVEFGLRTLGDAVADRDERVLDATPDLHERIRSATLRPPARHREIEPVRDQECLLARALELRTPRRDQCVEVPTEAVGFRTDDALVVLGEITDAL